MEYCRLIKTCSETLDALPLRFDLMFFYVCVFGLLRKSLAGPLGSRMFGTSGRGGTTDG